MTPEENFINLFNNYLPNLEKVEDLSKDGYVRKALNNDEEFAYAPGDDDRERNKKDTSKLIYSPERFLMPKMYQTDDMETLINPAKLTEFVKSAINGEAKLFWESEKVPKQKYSVKIVGEDFDKRILESKQDALVLIYHPTRNKNRALLDQYEEFVKVEGRKNKNLTFARYNGVNESSSFKSP